MILLGLLKLARGDKAGIAEFGNSEPAFTASLAPLIAFPLVGAALTALSGDWKSAALGLLARLSAVLALPVITYEFAARTGHAGTWLRTATALNWSFWVIIPLLLLASFAGAGLFVAGLPMHAVITVIFGVLAAYLLWYHWIIVRAGLMLPAGQAALLVGLIGAAITLCTAGQLLVAG
jgi:hypothetical protein